MARVRAWSGVSGEDEVYQERCSGQRIFLLMCYDWFWRWLAIRSYGHRIGYLHKKVIYTSKYQFGELSELSFY